jgi:hypothetical protein
LLPLFTVSPKYATSPDSAFPSLAPTAIAPPSLENCNEITKTVAIILTVKSLPGVKPYQCRRNAVMVAMMV